MKSVTSPTSIPEFPAGFRLGATLCAHAVEGADFASDWWHWEQRPGRIARGETSREGADHLGRYREDADLARRAGLNAVLVSLSWARVAPEPGRIDTEALAGYRARFDTWRARGLEPFAVLWETAAPQWFAEAGYWRAPDAGACFLDYAAATVDALKGGCTHWVPMARPEMWLAKACAGAWPGCRGGLPGAWRSRRCLANTLAEAVARIRATQPGAKVGQWRGAAGYEPEDPHSPWDLRAARGIGGLSPAGFHEALARETGGACAWDFTIASDLETRPVRFTPFRPSAGFQRQVRAGRPLAHGACAAALRAAGEGRPVYLCFEGPATTDETARKAAHLDHLLAAARAADAGIDVRGCFLGPLLNGFDWTSGYTRRGLVHVHRQTLARTPNPEVFMLGDIAAAGRVTPGALARHAPEWRMKTEEDDDD